MNNPSLPVLTLPYIIFERQFDNRSISVGWVPSFFGSCKCLDAKNTPKNKIISLG
jgi:hypothetical protein